MVIKEPGSLAGLCLDAVGGRVSHERDSVG